MDNANQIAITAIRDVDQEGFIAASLKRLGWVVVHRATSPQLLEANLLKYPDALLIKSNDFTLVEATHHEKLITLRERSEKNLSMDLPDPRSDIDLEELIRHRSTLPQPQRQLPQVTQAKIIGLLGAEGRIGATTLAINIADHLVQSGKKVLLVDADRAHHDIAYYLDIHEIRRQPKERAYNFHLYEIADSNQLQSLASVSEEFDWVVMDLGVIRDFSDNGVRIDDLLLNWIGKSQGELLICTSEGERSKSRIINNIEATRGISSGLTIEVAILAQKVLARKSRDSQIAEVKKYCGKVSTIFSREGKACEASRRNHSTLREVAPRCQLNREIGEHVALRLED